jgi:prepilin peptidase CpaA
MFEISYTNLMIAVVVPATLVACWIDYAARKVPNWLNLALALAGIAAQAAYFGWSGVGTAFAGLAVGIGVLIIPWAMHGMGAGDVKLMGAIGAWYGPMLCLWAFAIGAMVGGVIAVAMITLSRKWTFAVGNMGTILTKMQTRDRAFGEFGSARSFGETSSLLPYGIPLSIGAWIVLFMAV